MGYFRNVYEIVRGEDIPWVDTLKTARSTCQIAAGLALGGGMVMEVVSDSPKGRGIGVVLGMVAAAAEMGAWINNTEIRRIEIHDAVHEAQQALA